MKLDKENSTLNTSFGSVLTIVAYLTIFMYAYLKADVWLQKKDIDIMSSKMIDHLSNDYNITNKEGLNLAIAFTEFDTETEPILDESYGELVFYAYRWGVDEKGKYFVR